MSAGYPGRDQAEPFEEPPPGVVLAADCGAKAEPRSAEDLRAENAALRRLADAQERLTERLLAGGDVPALIETLGRLIGRPVVMMGAGTGVGSGPGGTGHPASAPGAPHVATPVALRGIVFGQLVVSGSAEPPDLGDRLILDCAARLIAMMLHRLRVDAESARLARERLLTDILSGGVGTEENLVARGAALGCDLSRPRCLLVVEPSEPRSAGNGDPPDRRLVGGVADALVDQPALVGWWQGRVVVLILGAPAPSPKSSCANGRSDGELARAIHGSLKQLFSGCTPSVGLAPECARLLDVPRLYLEAVEILGTARRLGRAGAIISTDDLDLRAYQILLGAHDEDRVQRFVIDVLGSLESYDARHHGALVKTLEAYLDHNGNLEATAAALYIHVSTLKYRLSRIAEIGSLRLHDPGDRFHAQLALRLRRLGRGERFSHSS